MLEALKPLEESYSKPEKPGDPRYLEHILNEPEKTEEEIKYLVSGAYSIPELFDAVEAIGTITAIDTESGKAKTLNPEEVKKEFEKIQNLYSGDPQFQNQFKELTKGYELPFELKLKASSVMPAAGIQENPFRKFADWVFLFSKEPVWRTHLTKFIDCPTWEKMMTAQDAAEEVGKVRIINEARGLTDPDEINFLREIRDKSRRARQKREEAKAKEFRKGQ